MRDEKGRVMVTRYEPPGHADLKPKSDELFEAVSSQVSESDSRSVVKKAMVRIRSRIHEATAPTVREEPRRLPDLFDQRDYPQVPCLECDGTGEMVTILARVVEFMFGPDLMRPKMCRWCHGHGHHASHMNKHDVTLER